LIEWDYDLLCEKCGSIDVARTQSSRVDRVVRFLTGRKRFTCMRCGWTALRAWLEPARPVLTVPMKPKRRPGPMLVARRRDDVREFEEGRLG
jgi:hypothetical protein